MLEWVDVIYCVGIQVMEYVVDAGAALAFQSYVCDPSTFNFLHVLIYEKVNDLKNHGSFVLAEVDTLCPQVLHLKLTSL